MVAARVSLIAFACLLSLAASTLAMPSSSSSSRILGGDDANVAQYPYVTSVRIGNSHKCVGSIIDNEHILTAGHCVSKLGTQPLDVADVSVRVGSINIYSGGQIVPVKAIAIHPSYGNFLHDLAILTVSSPLTFNEKINKIALAETEDVIDDGTAVTVTGWGVQEVGGGASYKLQHTSLTVLGRVDCEYEAGYGYESALCLSHPEKKGVCSGDDGAGVVANNKLYGLVSFFFGGCGTKYPDVATRISYYRDWIDRTIQQ